MRTVIIKVDSKEAEYIERLDYERGFTKDVLQRIIESHMEDPDVINSPAFKAYQKQGAELDAQFSMAVAELEKKYIPEILKHHKTKWNLEYKTFCAIVKLRESNEKNRTIFRKAEQIIS